MTTWFYEPRFPQEFQVTRARLDVCVPSSCDWTVLLIGWSWSCERGHQLCLLGGIDSSYFHNLHFTFLFPKEGFWFDTKTSGNICSQRTGLKLWAYTTLSVYVRESHKKCSGLISRIYFLEIEVGIVTKYSALNPIENAVRRQSARFWDVTHITWRQTCLVV